MGRKAQLPQKQPGSREPALLPGWGLTHRKQQQQQQHDLSSCSTVLPMELGMGGRLQLVYDLHFR